MKNENIIDIKISDIDSFKNHPFKIIDNDELRDMALSIHENGVLVPSIVRPKPDGRFELVSGHRRKKASQLAGKDKMPCIVRNLSNEEATLIMVDSNLQREKVLPSEKAFAYKMKLEALKHQGKRHDLLTSDPMGWKSSLESASKVGEQNGDSQSQVRRYIRLTYLLPEILDMVDNEKIAFRPAVELSYLTSEEQNILLDSMEFNQCTPSLHQAIQLKKLSKENSLDVDKIDAIMMEEKPNQTPKLKISMNKLKNVLPQTLKSDSDKEEFVIKAVKYYCQRQKKRQDKIR